MGQGVTSGKACTLTTHIEYNTAVFNSAPLPSTSPGDENLGGVGSKEDSRDAVQRTKRVDNKEGFDMGSAEFGPSQAESAVFGQPTPYPPESLVPGYQAHMQAHL